MADDYYKTLGLGRDASQADIQKAYRDLARKYHPDLNPDDKAAKEKFQEVQTAFDALGDADKRKKYDQFGPGFENVGGAPGGGPYTWSGGPGGAAAGGFGGVDIEELLRGSFGQQYESAPSGGFADFFKNMGRSSGRQRTRPAARGSDLQTAVEIPFNTAVTGGEVQLSVSREGGRVEQITVKVPAGIEHGKKIRLRGQGEPGRSQGPAGDILVEIRVADHPCFTRRGKQLDVTAPITLAEAARGGKIDVPTPGGEITLTIPPGTPGGKRLRVKKRGVAPAGETPGDLFVELQIVLPPSLDEDDLKKIDEIAGKHPQNPRRDLKW